MISEVVLSLHGVACCARRARALRPPEGRTPAYRDDALDTLDDARGERREEELGRFVVTLNLLDRTHGS